MHLQPVYFAQASLALNPVVAQLEKSPTVAILGSAQHPEKAPRMRPYYELLRLTADRLSRIGYHILTGGSRGANYHGNLGALPENSYAIHVREWQPMPNRRPGSDNSPLYRDVATVDSGAERSLLINRLANVLIIAPGGTGSLQEVANALESMYYGVKGAPEKLILLGRDFWTPFMNQLDHMSQWKLTDAKKFVILLDVHPARLPQAVNRIVSLVTGKRPSLFSRIGFWLRHQVARFSDWLKLLGKALSPKREAQV